MDTQQLKLDYINDFSNIKIKYDFNNTYNIFNNELLHNRSININYIRSMIEKNNFFVVDNKIISGVGIIECEDNNNYQLCEIENGKLHGKYIYFENEDGKMYKHITGNYINGKQDGEFVYYYKWSCNFGYPPIEKIINFKNGLLDGKYEKWRPLQIRGKTCIIKYIIAYYKKGLLDGHYKSYCDGEIEEIEYKNGKKDGKYIIYCKNGKTRMIENYTNGLLHGEQKYWFNNGQIKKISNYENHKLKGLYQEYDIKGNLKKEKIY